jgi:hypothetical protein
MFNSTQKCKISVAVFDGLAGSKSMELYVEESDSFPIMLLENTVLYFDTDPNKGKPRTATLANRTTFKELGLVQTVEVQPLEDLIEVDSCCEVWTMPLAR